MTNKLNNGICFIVLEPELRVKIYGLHGNFTINIFAWTDRRILFSSEVTACKKNAKQRQEIIFNSSNIIVAFSGDG